MTPPRVGSLGRTGLGVAIGPALEDGPAGASWSPTLTTASTAIAPRMTAPTMPARRLALPGASPPGPERCGRAPIGGIGLAAGARSERWPDDRRSFLFGTPYTLEAYGALVHE